MTAPRPDDALADLTYHHLLDCEPHKGGYITPCNDWVDRHTVGAHARTCVTCQQVAKSERVVRTEGAE